MRHSREPADRAQNLAALVWLLNMIVAWLLCTLLVAIPAAMLLREWFG